jgi:phosphatidylserine/phosphatidylglycerophosphate/cardiolipin synthase-like enzyme
MSAFDNPILGSRRALNRLAVSAFSLMLFLSVAHPAEESPSPVVEAVFGKDCETLLVREINRAKKEIVVAIYSMTRRNITSALADAVERGVKVRLKYDVASADSDDMKSAIQFLKKQEVKCTGIKMSDDYARMHHKFTVIDGQRVLTGSYNYTSSATTVNYENMVLIESREIARQFAEEFERIKSR